MPGLLRGSAASGPHSEHVSLLSHASHLSGAATARRNGLRDGGPGLLVRARLLRWHEPHVHLGSVGRGLTSDLPVAQPQGQQIVLIETRPASPEPGVGAAGAHATWGGGSAA